MGVGRSVRVNYVSVTLLLGILLGEVYIFPKSEQNFTERKENGLSYSLFKTRRVSREMQHDRLQASTLIYLLRSRSGVRCGDGGCTRGGGRAS